MLQIDFLHEIANLENFGYFRPFSAETLFCVAKIYKLPFRGISVLLEMVIWDRYLKKSAILFGFRSRKLFQVTECTQRRAIF
jgi:hypothetical protein